jgi:thiamine pyrophosphokinase
MGEIERRCLILGGGEICDYGGIARLAAGCAVICADSGYSHLEPLGMACTLLVGDFDSLSGPVPEHIPRVTLPADKDYTDTDLAVREALKRGYTSFVMAGVTGGRPDHTLANIQVLLGLSRRGISAMMSDGVTDYHAFTAPVQGDSYRLPFKSGYYFSVFAQGAACKRVNIRGGKYPLVDYDLAFDEARAVSNEFLDGDATITMESGTVLIVTTPK